MQSDIQILASVDFTDKGNFAEFPSDGFSNQEYFGTWSIGTHSHITIPVTGRITNLKLHLTIQPYINSLTNAPTSISLTVGDRNIVTYWSSKAEWIDLSLDIPGAIDVPPEGLHLGFDHPSSIQPLSAGISPDLRALAFMFQSLRLTGKSAEKEDFLPVGDIDSAGGIQSYAADPNSMVDEAQTSTASEEFAVNQVSPSAALSDSPARSPAPLELVFALGGNGVACQRSGWAAPESHGSWTVGPESVLIVPGLVASFDYRCILPLNPFLHPPELATQTLRVTANGIDVHTETLMGASRVEFVIPAIVIQRRQPVELVLHCARPTPPNSFRDDPSPAQDLRPLGFAIWGLSIWPMSPSHYVLPVSTAPVSLAPPPKVAAVTMVYNESVYLPIWLHHNARQVGIENCYVVDHGSTDGSTDNLGACNVIRIPRSPYDPAKQSAWNSDFCNSLLNWFDYVIYSDVDEILMADPAVAPTLIEYCRRPLPDVVSAIGLNTLHLLDEEPALDLSQPVSAQRPYVFACASMCKPLLIHRKVTWSPGSHSSDAKLKFDHLYMFHLRWFDHPLGIERLHKTRAMQWAQDDQGQHQRVADAELEAQMRGFGAHHRLSEIDFNPDLEPVNSFLRRVEASTVGRENDLYKIDLDIWHNQLWRIPSRFVGTF